jgi:hypothetical protein
MMKGQFTAENCGHFIPEEQPEEVLTYVRRLAEKASRGSPALQHSCR